MKLLEALNVVNEARARIGESGPELRYFLACGFEPLHLRTLLTGHLQSRFPAAKVTLLTGQFGDLAGNLRRALASDGAGTAVAIEWSDLDPHLGFRQLGGWTPSALSDIPATVESALARLGEAMADLSQSQPVAVSLPTLPPAPAALAELFRAGPLELELEARLAAFAAKLAADGRIRVVGSALDATSPKASRRDLNSEIGAGFPYAVAHASAVAEALAALLAPAPLKKGIITDLDGVFWSGVLGENGVDGIGWDLSSHALVHGLYQQALEALAARGALVAVASKNDAALVRQALARPDLRMPGALLYPIESHWRPKSESIRAILKTWNIAADSVVFIDDSPMELAEVQSAHPGIECLLFSGKPADFPALLERLRLWFGKCGVSQEDLLRSDSIRAGAAWRDAETAASDSFEQFLSQAAATASIAFGKAAATPRALDLVNKTNQFNLNGRRYSEAEWKEALARPSALLLAVEYSDRFGPLGVISVALGRREGSELRLECWVMSCRAFARRIEHRLLASLFDRLQLEEISFDYAPTERNQPVKELFTSLEIPAPGARLEKAAFKRLCPRLYHTVEVRYQ